MAESNSFRVAGFEVQFPHEAYGVQKVFMNQVLKAIHNQENALLEAPTGCGKTLSLLCGALAWQDAQKRKRTAAEQARKEKREAENADAKPGSCLAPLKQNSKGAGEATSDVDDPQEPDEEILVPKIYYATRTHSQIAQVVRELKRTAYRPRMTVLGSRPHYCINKTAQRHKDGVDAACEEMLKDQLGCRFKKNAMTLTHGLVKVHDIEDLAKIGSRHKACPYFGSRHLAETADLIFCPYSYLLDPNIRRATKVQAADAILIFDEAHNIEDQAREAGSMDLDINQLKKTYLGLYKASVTSSESDSYEPLKSAVLQLITWLVKLGEGGPQQAGFRSAGFERFERLWTGQQMIETLSEAGLDPQSVEHLWTCYEKARAAEDKAGFATEGEAANAAVSSDIASPRAGGAALGYVSSLLTTLRLLYGSYSEVSTLPDEQPQQQAGPPGATTGQVSAVKAVQMTGGGDHVTDYRLAIQMWVERDSRNRGRGRDRGFTSDSTAEEFAAAAPGATSSEWAMSMGIWCLNPSVVFKCLSDVARSVLLASGTLSPLDTFSGELGLDFHVKLEAPHVVDMHRQVMARVVSHGPDGRQLCATYKEADKLDYQDSLGRLVLEVAKVVPDGVLLFLPSYVLMDKLRDRWKATGIWNEIEHLKHIVAEPRKAGDEFDAAIAEYYKAVQQGPGGLFMAVCRGKASEGIDFADGNARCVIVVGIPFPNVKDSKVGLKKDYNNASATARPGFGNSRAAGMQHGRVGAAPPKLLSGDQWYSQQAFRALNQAVGRCIRHRYDYGAILLVDERFRQPRHQQCLSKWVRGAISTPTDTPKLLHEMKGFFDGLEANPPSAAAAKLQQPVGATAGLIKPGYEALPMLAKPGFEPGPVVKPGSGKPGYESAAGAGAGVPWHLQDSFDSKMRSKPGYEAAYAGSGGADNNNSKPGYEATAGRSDPSAAAPGSAGCGDGSCAATAQARWQAPMWQGTASEHMPAQQQGSRPSQQLQQTLQPAQQQQGNHQPQQQHAGGEQKKARLSGPMDAFLVKQDMQQPPLQLQQQPQQQQWQPGNQEYQQQHQQQQQQQHSGHHLQQHWQPQQPQQGWQHQQQHHAQAFLVKQEPQCWQDPQHGHQQLQQPEHQHDSAPSVGHAPGSNTAEGPGPPAHIAKVGTLPDNFHMLPSAVVLGGAAAAAAGANRSGDAQVASNEQHQPAQLLSPDGKGTRVMPVSMQQQQQQRPGQAQLQQQQQQQPQAWQQQQGQWQQQKTPAGKPVSCMSMLGGQLGDRPLMQQQQQWQQQQQQQHPVHQDLQVDAAPPVSTLSGTAANIEKANPAAASVVPESPAAAVPEPKRASPEAAEVAPGAHFCPAAAAPGLAARMPSAATAAHGTAAVQPGAVQDHSAGVSAAGLAAGQPGAATDTRVQPVQAVEASVGAEAPATMGAPAAAEVAPAVGAAAMATAAANPSVSTSTVRCQSLGVPEGLLHQWVRGDVASMAQQLRSQGVPADGAQGCELQQLVCFGIMGSFELAADILQQQQQGPAHQSSAASPLSSFWSAWHSYVPLGLLAVATACGQLPSPHQQQRFAQQIQQVQGSWLGVMQSRPLLESLCAMAEAYDQALDTVTQQQQLQGQPCDPQQPNRPQQQQPVWSGQWQQGTSQCMSGPQQQPNHHQQQQPYHHQQQQPWQRSAGGPQQQWSHHHQQQQQQWSGQHNAQQYGLQQQQDQKAWQHQHPQPQQCQPPAAHPGHTIAATTGVQGVKAPATSLAGGISCNPGIGVGPGPPGVLQLSQSARQPKRAALRSDKAQKAAQKRNKQSQSARLAAALPAPRASSKASTPAATGNNLPKAGTKPAILDSTDDDDFV